MRERRFYLPPGSPASSLVARRCASAVEEVERYPFAATSGLVPAVDGTTAWMRLRTARAASWRYNNTRPRRVSFELDLQDVRGVSVQQYDLPSTVPAARVAGLLKALSEGYEVDRAIVGFGDWGDARLQLEDRASARAPICDYSRLLVVVRAPAGWGVPDEWAGAVEVTDDPRWQRPALTARTWPPTFASADDPPR